MWGKEKDPFVVIVVLNWNLPEETVACVDSLLAGDYPCQSVLVVDNGSTDDSVPRLRGRFGDAIRLVETGENLLYAGGNNVGLRSALELDADFVLVLNNDARVAADAVSRLVETARQRPRAGVLAPAIYWGHAPDRFWSLGTRHPAALPLPLDVGRGETDRGQYDRPFAVDYVTGCAMFLRRAVLEEVGPFDPRYRMYYEDADLCARARKAGFEVLVEPRAKVWHLVSATAGKQGAVSVRRRARYRARFYRQHTRGPLKPLTYAFLWGQGGARSALDLARGRRETARARWQGLREGFREPLPPEGAG